VDADEYRRSSLANWEEMSAGWERRRTVLEKTSAPVTEWLVQHLAPEPGHTILELAAGPGDTGFAVAPVVGEEGRLISSDFSPEMLEVGRRRSAELGLTNVEHRVIDAERIELEDDSVDGVLCRFGYMLMADPAAALAETRRVLRPGGRLTLAVWSAFERNPFFGIIGVSLVQRGYIEPPEPAPAPGPFSMASAQRTEGLLRRAGFAEARTEELPGRFVLPDIDEYLSVIADTAGPFALALRGLDAPDRAAVRTDVEDSLRRFAVDGGYELPCVALCAVAR
jgi:SAM-dependent methyltransferase